MQNEFRNITVLGIYLFHVSTCFERHSAHHQEIDIDIQGGSNMTGTDLYVNKPHCAAAVRP